MSMLLTCKKSTIELQYAFEKLSLFMFFMAIIETSNLNQFKYT